MLDQWDGTISGLFDYRSVQASTCAKPALTLFSASFFSSKVFLPHEKFKYENDTEEEVMPIKFFLHVVPGSGSPYQTIQPRLPGKLHVAAGFHEKPSLPKKITGLSS